KQHAKLGHEMLYLSKRPILNAASIVSYEHHERWDGKGYPNGLKGEETHIYGRITAIADVFDALGSARVYKPAWDDEKIFELFKEERGAQFDPKLVDIFFENKEKLIAIRDKFADKVED
ncbi:MAG: HD domain-containing phosphohydrolase, partial [Campylobacterota bacterium]|nr:HD domain-containing phosphohydrolase [Campylobacterota bacterium]